MKELVLCDDGKPEVVLPLCKKYGLGIEIQGFADPLTVKNQNKLLRDCKKLLQGVESRYLHAPYGDLCLGSKAEKIVKATKFYFDYAYKVSKNLNVKSITVHHGYVPGASFVPKWIERSVKFWNGYLVNKKINFNMENQFEVDGEISKEIIEKVSNPMLGLNLDIGHAHCNSKASVIDWIKLLGDKIKYVHLHDNHGEWDEHLGLTKGNIDLVNVLNALNEHAPNAVWALECKLEDMESSIEFLKLNKFI